MSKSKNLEHLIEDIKRAIDTCTDTESHAEHAQKLGMYAGILYHTLQVLSVCTGSTAVEREQAKASLDDMVRQVSAHWQNPGSSTLMN